MFKSTSTILERAIIRNGVCFCLKDPNARKRSTVAVFGDPHLYVFGANMEAGKMMTCLSPGNTVYIKNKFLEINGVNTPVNENDPLSATYMTSVKTINNLLLVRKYFDDINLKWFSNSIMKFCRVYAIK